MSASKSPGFCLSHDSVEFITGNQEPGALAYTSLYISVLILDYLGTLSPTGRHVCTCVYAGVCMYVCAYVHVFVSACACICHVCSQALGYEPRHLIAG